MGENVLPALGTVINVLWSLPLYTNTPSPIKDLVSSLSKYLLTIEAYNLVVLTFQLNSLCSWSRSPFYLLVFSMHAGEIMAEIWGHSADSRNISLYLLLLSIGILVTTNEGLTPRGDLKLFQ